MRNTIFLFLVLVASVAHSQDQPDKLIARERAAFLTAHARTMSVSSPNYDVHFYRCNWVLDPAVRYIKGAVTVQFTMLTSSSDVTMDMLTALTVDSVLYHGTKISFTATPPDALKINFPAPITAGTKDSFTVFYQGAPPNTGFGSFNMTTHAGVPAMWSLSEPYGAKSWWPCKDVLTDKADSIDIILTYPQAYRSQANGLPVNEVLSGGMKTTTWKHRYPIATYLIAFAISNYQETTDVTTSGNKTIPLVLNTYPENTGTFINALIVSKAAIPIFSNLFGEYPFANERYAQTQFSWGGGMEHQTNTFISSAGGNLISHELGHQWFGDKVTTASWQDLWLNEGFATYMEYVFIEQYNPPSKISMLNTWKTNITSTPGGSVFIPDTSDINRLFDARLTYRKGGHVLHMLRWKLGDSVFFRGVKRYLNDPLLRYKNAKTADLKRNLQTESGQNLDEFFDDWIYGEGYPNYSATWKKLLNKKIEVKLFQTTSHPSVDFYEMPVPLQFKNATRDTILVVDHQFSGQTFVVDPGFVPDTMIIDPQQWILTKTKSTLQQPAEESKELLVYPNPSPGNFTIALPSTQPQETTVQVFNTVGQLLWTTKVPANTFNVTVPAYRWAAGLYWIRISGSAGYDEKRAVLITGR